MHLIGAKKSLLKELAKDPEAGHSLEETHQDLQINIYYFSYCELSVNCIKTP